MRSKTLKINYNHMKNELLQDYFKYLDIFHKSFLVTLVYLTTPDTPLTLTSKLENAHYSYLLTDMFNNHCKGENLLEIFTDKEKYLLVDLQVYLQEFLVKTHNFKAYNIYNLTIDHEYNLVITSKQMGRYVI